jgi:vesicle coat complex subunit
VQFGTQARAAVPALRTALKDEEPNNRLLVAMSLGALGPAAASAVPDLGRALRTDKDARVRYRAAVALGAMGREAQAAVEALRRAAEDSSAEVRRAAAEALEQIERDKFQP